MSCTCDGHGPGMMGSVRGLLRARLWLSDRSVPGPTKGLARTFKEDVTSFPALLSSRDCGRDDESPAEESLFEAMLG